tara:strand:- start:118 stop:225 length:108 start_codon:yes stop_codon:yes gene_type:complete
MKTIEDLNIRYYKKEQEKQIYYYYILIFKYVKEGE